MAQRSYAKLALWSQGGVQGWPYSMVEANGVIIVEQWVLVPDVQRIWLVHSSRAATDVQTAGPTWTVFNVN